jgi:hypothetical protein
MSACARYVVAAAFFATAFGAVFRAFGFAADFLPLDGIFASR